MRFFFPSSLLPFITIFASLSDCGTTPVEFADPSTVCYLLKQAFSNVTYLPSDPGYGTENKGSWDASSWLGPACVFAPRNAEELSYAVKALVNSSTLFAMRGGGHMPISDAANINSTGVQISSTNLKTLKLSEDRQTMSIGPGPRWGDVFTYMDGTNLTVLGGRMPPVGVPGLLLGGGISYFSYAHGLAASEGKIKAYECVLADGTIATVTARGKYSDLYWALQGGGNSFALVTRFDLQTFPLETTLRGEALYEESEGLKDSYLNAVLDVALNGDEDTHAALTPTILWAYGSTNPIYQGTLFYNGSIAPACGPFATFHNGSIKSVNSSSTMRPQSLAEYAALLRGQFEDGGAAYGLRQRFHVVTVRATREAMDIIYDAWDLALRSANMTSLVPGFYGGLSYNVVTRTFAERSQGMAMHISVEPQFWVEESISWKNAADDSKIENFLLEVNREIDSKLTARKLNLPYLYLNDANRDQPVFEGYGQENVERLNQIREKYDPGRVFTDLMPGGFKVATVKI